MRSKRNSCGFTGSTSDGPVDGVHDGDVVTCAIAPSATTEAARATIHDAIDLAHFG
jgi:hypothetical protein